MAAGPMTGLSVDIEVPGRLRAAFAVERGAVVAVLGPNGAGKSTLLHAVAGLLGDVGAIVVDGATWSAPGSTPKLVRERRVGMAFQGRSLFPHLSAAANVAFGPRSRGVPGSTARAMATDWLTRFGIADLADRKPDQLSGGQAQRVSLARALAADPQLLLLDEPFAGLDIGVATSLRLELADHLAAFEGTTLLVTHDALDAFTLADTVLVVNDGAVAQLGPPGEVAARPVTEHVARLVGLNVLRDGERLTSFRPDAVTVSLARPEGSARLQWSGRVLSTAPHGDALRARVQTMSGVDLLADVTPAAAVELGLTVGREVWLSVKATSVQTYAAGS